MESLIQEHDDFTTRSSNLFRDKTNCCKNFCRMWSYKKVVTQKQQYDFNMRKI